MRTVVVVVNKSKPFTHASDPLRVQLPGAVVSGFFVAPTSSVPHTKASTYMGGVGENIGQRHHPADNPLELCARYPTSYGDKVRQDPYRTESHPYGEASATARHGLRGGATHPWGNYCLENL